MKVHELIEHLRHCKPDARVYLAVQPDYPFECYLEGVVTRQDFDDDDEDQEDGQRSDDVLLLQGDQARYGRKRAWGR